MLIRGSRRKCRQLHVLPSQLCHGLVNPLYCWKGKDFRRNLTEMAWCPLQLRVLGVIEYERCRIQVYEFPIQWVVQVAILGRLPERSTLGPAAILSRQGGRQAAA